jgi:glyoxylase-like metal-dependent hydrolase (beta-lactamase superfamily II)
MESTAYRPEPLAAGGGRELAPGVHRIESDAGGRPLYLFLLRGERTVLVDSGFATTPEAALLPYLAGAGVTPDQIDLLICTHADADHHGGCRALTERAPRLLVSCGARDRRLVADPAVLVAERCECYRTPHGLGYDDELLRSIPRLAPAVPVDIAWSGGETIRLGDDWELTIVATPGHSHGHVAVHDHRHRAVYMGDAVHGALYPGFDGRPALPPNYVDVDAYLRTIEVLAALDLDALHGAHWPPQRGHDAVQAFLQDARDEVEHTGAAVRRALEHAGELDAREIIASCSAELGGWSGEQLMYSVDAHLRRLERSGAVVRERASDRDVFRRRPGP